MCKNPENMNLYNFFRECPKEAQKPITAGRLKGKTDINPMWRLKKLTESFGPCGIGWTYRIVRTWIERGAVKRQFNDRGELLSENAEMTANVEIALKFKYNGEWSEEIPGIGGSMFCELESRGFNTEDEAYKKALTDAISVACKALGIAADIYFAKDPDSKYDTGVPDGIPFPEAYKQDAPLPIPPSPASLMCRVKTREDAQAYTLDFGDYKGKRLTEVYKLNKQYFISLRDNPPNPDVAAATSLIWQWIAESNRGAAG